MIQVEGLRKSFADVRAVDGVDLAVEQGEILVLLGQNGAGKSTTLRCLGGILRPDAGTIALDGLRLPEKLDEVRSRLGVVPDQARLYGRNTAPEYLDHFGFLYGVPADVRKQRIAGLLERFELADRTDTVLAAYSRGMAQKVALIRATLHEPDWIFCDEPTAGLDPVAAADMRRYLGEQRARGAALIVTTHVLGEAELMADRIAIMKRGRIVKSGALDELRAESGQGRKFVAALTNEPRDEESLRAWLRTHTLDFNLEGKRLSYVIPWDTPVAARGELAAALQRELSTREAPFHELEEEQISLESVYLSAMEEQDSPPPPAAGAQIEREKRVLTAPGAQGRVGVVSGIPAREMFGSIAKQGRMLRHALPFYVSSWWRRGDLSWVMYLNAFVLLLVGGTSLFGQLPGQAGQVAARFAGGQALQAGLLLPLFFMSFALLESIKSSIGIWWEKAQQSLEVLLYTPVDDPSLIWLEVLPGAVVSTVWVTLWMAAGLAMLTFFGESAPWDLLPVFAFVAAVTSYWAAMGRMLGFMLFPREGASGGAWSFLLSPVSAAVADLPLALFVFRSPFATASLLLPIVACVALTVLCGVTFDRERLMETGVGRTRRKRVWLATGVIRRNAAALAAGVLLAIVPAGVAAAVTSNAGLHSWSEVAGSAGVAQHDPSQVTYQPAASSTSSTSGVTVAAAGLAGVVGTLALMLLLMVVSFAAFFLLGLPAVLGVMTASALWGIQFGFGGSAPLEGWLVGATGFALLALALNTGAALPIYWSLVFGSGRRLDRLRDAWASYWALYRSLVIPACALFGLVVFRLLAAG
ncbi:MAG TPA: ATP-binding cassette domain-containing protein [Candidatus Dormibacteraeota bacterium]|nr:ATP-binding cassette domain-containing protein [Candidatus Dormibacteraeota bacterium]